MTNGKEIKNSEKPRKEEQLGRLKASSFRSSIIGPYAHEEGQSTVASGQAAHSEGRETVAKGFASHAEGDFSLASGPAAHAEGYSLAKGSSSHSEGRDTMAEGNYSHAEGQETAAKAIRAHAEGGYTVASAEASHAEGSLSSAKGIASHTEGGTTIASGVASHAEGQRTNAEGLAAHAEGEATIASKEASHAEGEGTQALSIASHAEGKDTTANFIYSHAEGLNTTASGLASHAEGFGTKANGFFSHAEGRGTSTNNLSGAHIMGNFGNATDSLSWHLANGTNNTNQSLAAKILNNGTGIADNGWVTGNADYAEMFETVDEQLIDVGYFVTFDGESDKIRKANATDDYILGIVSANPAILADSGELRWKNKYVTDRWGKIQYHEAVIPAETDKDGNLTIPEHTEIQPILNPDWDHTREYIPRSMRTEWAAIGLLGKLPVRDDGTCKPGKYCIPNDEGIATYSNKGYRVMKRTGPNQIWVLIK
ncbi:peptidase G2 autoproteolytic cleavage domain-containing protein [Bacillus toyonensis]|uniref:peptidase G2 autoproteolytic cleavage domain-containing protein n=1 Tax=Bacillus toyonensis TaxID=155322 RepID=UPI000BEB58F1|nr:peptidase G2 autoproteolytic cleavage domain-containing protein [Bacillus toyonensis]PDY86777.1 hypothetical protein CON67_23900 [Bacillus toyonensis]